MKRKGKCPHELVQYCPLYVAAHIAGAGGCDDGKLELGTCAVSRGLDYAKRLAELERTQFEMVARCQWAEKAAAAKRQIEANMRAAGLSTARH